jgi:hypothetical protein
MTRYDHDCKPLEHNLAPPQDDPVWKVSTRSAKRWRCPTCKQRWYIIRQRGGSGEAKRIGIRRYLPQGVKEQLPQVTLSNGGGLPVTEEPERCSEGGPVCATKTSCDNAGRCLSEDGWDPDDKVDINITRRSATVLAYSLPSELASRTITGVVAVDIHDAAAVALGRFEPPEDPETPAGPQTDAETLPRAERDALAVGFTPAEAHAWELVRAAANACLRLTEQEPHHGMEREEMCHGFHTVQGWLASRPTMRAMEQLAGD